MKTSLVILGSLLAAGIVAVLVQAPGRRAPEREVALTATSQASSFPSTETAEAYEGSLYGRITTVEGSTYEGRLRWRGDEEMFWGDYFNGLKDENPWAVHVPSEQLEERRSIEILGIEIGHWERRIDLDRPFMARFGDVARIEAHGRDIRVVLKSGTVFDLDRLASDDLGDGVRVWDGRLGIVDLDEWQIRTLELLPAAGSGLAPGRLHGTVRTRQGIFTGFVQWDRKQRVGADVLAGRNEDGELSLRFDTVRSIVRDAQDGSRVTLLDGREVVLTGTRAAGRGCRRPACQDHASERRRAVARARRGPQRWACGYADLRRRPRASRVRALEECRTDRLGPGHSGDQVHLSARATLTSHRSANRREAF